MIAAVRRLCRPVWLAAAVLALVALTGCTRAQIAAWVAWHDDDPVAAETFAARPDVARSLITGGLWTSSSDANQFAEWLAAGSPSPGDCDSYVPLLERYGLPVATFKRIAWRESGCNHTSFVINRTDAGGGLLGINLKGSLAATWHAWCGVTLATVTDAETNIACAAAAYQRMGMQPWS